MFLGRSGVFSLHLIRGAFLTILPGEAPCHPPLRYPVSILLMEGSDLSLNNVFAAHDLPPLLKLITINAGKLSGL